ncbi:phage tail tape measure protein [Sphingomonas melonis]|uniref:phage tail tape measure protein n=1 Tax=Sphingomonas melonis TaxID=152682 RepID=UPI000372940B|nr:phage tail tape measure protein [Sphingomonas melonis]
MADRNLRIRMLLEAGDRVTRPLRDMAAGSTRTAQALKATRDRLKEIERAQADLAGFRQLKAGMQSSSAAMRAAQARATALGREIGQTASPTRAMTREFAKAKAEAERLTRQHQQESIQLRDMRERLRAAGIATSDLARHERELRTQAAGANREIEEQSRRVRELADRERRASAARERFARVQGMAANMAASGAAAIGTGVAMGSGIWAGVKAAQEYESTMTTIAQKADMPRVKAVQLGKELLGAAKAANQLPDALQEGVDTLAGFGLGTDKAVAMMRPIGRAATAYKAEIADLSAAAFAANDNLKVPVEQTARVIDVMARAGKDGAFEIKDMAGAFPALTAGYQALGQTGIGAVADLSAALQIARKGAGDSATAATNVSNIIQKIASPATIKAFSKFGIDLPKALKKAYAEGKTPLEAIAELTSKATNGDLGKIGFLFEDAQVQQGLRPLIQNMEEYRRIRASAAGASGTTDRDFAERMKDSAEQSKQLAINAKALGITLGSMLLPTVNAVTVRATAFAESIGRAAQRHPVLAKYAAIGAAGLAALFVVFGAGAIALAGIMGPIAIVNAGLVAMGVAGGVASIGLAPIIGVVLAIAGAVALFFAAWNHWGEITAAWFAFWGGIRNSFIAAGNWLSTTGVAMLKSAGMMILRGLLGGLDPNIVFARIRGIAQGAIRIFKSVMGIHSPSRVFASLGGYLMDGLSNGIADGERQPVARLHGLSRRMTSAIAAGTLVAGVAAPAGAAGARAGGRGEAQASRSAAPTPITIHVHGAPGQNEQTLAQAVAREVAKAMAGQSSNRGSYADRDDF